MLQLRYRKFLLLEKKQQAQTGRVAQQAEQVGARLNEQGCIGVDAHQRTSVPGLYAAGDVVIGLDQISHAMGEGGVAATTIRNDLCSTTPRWREPKEEMEKAESGV